MAPTIEGGLKQKSKVNGDRHVEASNSSTTATATATATATWPPPRTGAATAATLTRSAAPRAGKNSWVKRYYSLDGATLHVRADTEGSQMRAFALGKLQLGSQAVHEAQAPCPCHGHASPLVSRLTLPASLLASPRPSHRLGPSAQRTPCTRGPPRASCSTSCGAAAATCGACSRITSRPKSSGSGMRAPHPHHNHTATAATNEPDHAHDYDVGSRPKFPSHLLPHPAPSSPPHPPHPQRHQPGHRLRGHAAVTPIVPHVVGLHLAFDHADGQPLARPERAHAGDPRPAGRARGNSAAA